jgi:hypothetical protein
MAGPAPRVQPTQLMLGALRGTAGAAAFGRRTMIGPTGTQASGRSSNCLPSGVFRKPCAKPIRQEPRPADQAASIRFSAASVQSSTIHGPCATAEIRITAGAW